MMRAAPAQPPGPVILNLFQDPSRVPLGGLGSRATVQPGCLATARAGVAARWTLKQVQGDDQGKEALSCD